MFRTLNLERYAQTLAENFNWTNTYGVARTILAIGSLITLSFNDIHMLVQPLGPYFERDSHLNPILHTSLFALLQEHLVLAKWIAIAILLVVASGWRPRIMGILHWWVAFSVWASSMVIDGGDQITAIITLLLIPVCLADGRKWHWTTSTSTTASTVQKHLNLLAIATLFVIRLQVAFIYFHASVGKMAVEEWMNGTALYYWSRTPLFMMPNWLEPILNPIFSNGLTLTLATWSIMAFELLLFMGLVMHKKWHPILLATGIAFHFSIILMYGLVSFFCAMTASLILFFGPKDKGFNFSWLRSLVAKLKPAPAPETIHPLSSVQS